jgi:hypothetical protein
MSHCKKVRDMKVDVKRALRWAKRGRGAPPQVITYTLPDGTPCAALRWVYVMNPPCLMGPP